MLVRSVFMFFDLVHGALCCLYLIPHGLFILHVLLSLGFFCSIMYFACKLLYSEYLQNFNSGQSPQSLTVYRRPMPGDLEAVW